MSGIKDSNVLGLETIVNKEAINNDQLAEIKSLDASVNRPSEYEFYAKQLFGDDSDAETVDIPESESESRSSTDGESVKSYSRELSEDSESIEIRDPLLVTGSKGMVDLDTKNKSKITDDHTTILNDIKVQLDRLKDKNLMNKVPKYKERDIVKNKTYASEIRNMLKNMADDHTTADSLESMLSFVLGILCKTFHGQHSLFGYKIDLRGYKVLVMSDLKDVKEDTVEMVSKVRKKVGRLPMKLFLLLKIFAINLGITIVNNNTTNEDHDYDDFSDSDGDGDSYETDEEDDEDRSSDKKGSMSE